MYLYFEDFSFSMPRLDQRGIPHGDKIIKVYPSQEDPRVLLSKPKLAIIESDSHPFTDELFVYPGRASYTGIQIEELIRQHGLSMLGEEAVRALFRFSNRPDLESCQAAMAATKDGGWLINNPLEDIDGLPQASRDPERRTLSLHLDIFFQETLARLNLVVDFKNQEHLVGMRDGLRLKGLDSGIRRGIEK